MENGNTVVSVQHGQLCGTVEQSVYGTEFFAFRGIPYAKPPLGDLRFKDPEPLEPWSGVRNATKFADVCAQFDIIRREVIGSDDCLYLNVYTTALTVMMLRPVMVWIHGGGFVVGSGNDDVYGPDYIVPKDVVLVTCNYRLGILGFLNLEDPVAPGNQGLKDQVMVLKWVRENIAKFGGDPNNVTIFGESSGGAAVHYLTLSPLADGLFHKAIAQSGVALNTWARVTHDPKKYALRVAADLGNNSCDPKAIVDFLRTISAQELINSQNKMTTREELRKVMAQFGPGPDYQSPNPFLAQHITRAAHCGVKVPFMLGFNENEGSFLLKNPSDKELRAINDDFGIVIHPATAEVLQHDGISVNDLRSLYFGNQSINRDTLAKYAEYLGDAHFERGIFEVANVQIESSIAPTYFYRFTYDEPNSLWKRVMNIELPGTTHAEDIMFLFYSHLMEELNLEPPKPGSVQYKILQYFTEMWTNFAKTGNPTPTTNELISVKWMPLKRGMTYDYLRIDEELKMESIDKATRRSDWKKLKNKL